MFQFTAALNDDASHSALPHTAPKFSWRKHKGMYFILAWQNSVGSYTFFIFKQLFTYVLIKENFLYSTKIGRYK